MLHAYHVSPESGRKFQRRTVKCSMCGREIEYNTCPPKLCLKCKPRRPSRLPPKRRIESRKHQASLRKRAKEEIIEKVEVKEEVTFFKKFPIGLCQRCGCIRLSPAELMTGTCWCCIDNLKEDAARERKENPCHR